MFACPATDDFFRSRIDQMIDLRHPLAVLSSRMPWQQIEASVSHLFIRKARGGRGHHPTSAIAILTSCGDGVLAQAKS